ncbi:PD-(D/E)XK nuclease family protein [Mannheimia sp. AT1]|uniref:PD-(D/E)XK nuclease family protein n=1 Tax=Mannheimia cairinae TaxID=3025936 RepID=A0ABT5MQF5_9PAST|nr:PD-(D/E)XK nuclease family protein [Mannheimia cairinae]MDD0824418.1 PD-(D/E)XK nuclease family protein [Mannheimia cairinae]MDD0825519.1 PD-(D/E)XK nuclease family protein [Mannheimia cairinae]
MSYTSILANLTSLVEQEEKQEQLFLEREKQESTLFNPFQFMRTDEDGLSYILSTLLDPKGNHGQQALFLEQFLLGLVKEKNLDVSLLKFNKNSTKVVVHQPTYTNFYHDIFIETDHWVMSIESKLNNAKEQPYQIFNYISDLEKKNKDHCFMLYLPISEKEPTTGICNDEDKWNALKDINKATVITPNFLYNWLSNCEMYRLSPRMTEFISYFKSFLCSGFNLGNQQEIKKEHIHVEMEQSEFESLFEQFKQNDFLLQYKKEFTQLIKIVKGTEYYKKITEYCREELAKQLKEKLDGCTYRLDDSYSLKQDNSIYPIYLIPKKAPAPFWICYENLGRGYHGIMWNKSTRENFPKLNEIFSKIQSERGDNVSKNYPIYNYCPQDYLAYWNDTSWVTILDGSLIEDLWKNIQGLVENKEIIDSF